MLNDVQAQRNAVVCGAQYETWLTDGYEIMTLSYEEAYE
jgi:hypothetical protein